MTTDDTPSEHDYESRTATPSNEWVVSLLPFMPYISQDVSLDNSHKLSKDVCSKDKITGLEANALDYIIEEARKHEILIINEAHNDGRHRALIYTLLEKLKPLGYSLYASETFNIGQSTHEEWNNSLKQRTYPLKSDGYYLRDPIYGQVIRRALELGYNPIAYEALNVESRPSDKYENFSEREVVQGNNILDRAIKKYPGKKLIIHVGFSHNKEDLDTNGTGWMAKYIKDATDINPLTISQVNCTLPYGVDQDLKQLKYYDRSIAAKHGLDTKGVDINLFKPKPLYKNGRANWLKGMNRYQVKVPNDIAKLKTWVFVAAYPLNVDKEFLNTVPYDGIPNTPGALRNLALEPGKYSIKAFDKEKNVLNEVIVDVP